MLCRYTAKHSKTACHFDIFKKKYVCKWGPKLLGLLQETVRYQTPWWNPEKLFPKYEFIKIYTIIMNSYKVLIIWPCCSKYLTYMNLFNPHSNPHKAGTIWSPFYRGGNWGKKQTINSSQFSQLVMVNQTGWLQSWCPDPLCMLHHCLFHGALL